MKRYIFKIKPDSAAEKYFVNELMKECKDKVICRLGYIFGRDWNEYEVTHDDYIRIETYNKKKKGSKR